MDTVTAIKSVIMAIAAQGSVTVTIPNDTELTRDLDPVEITRQLGPIELKIKTAPGKPGIKVAPTESATQSGTAKIANQVFPNKTVSKAAPAVTTNKTSPVETTNKAAPAETTTKAAPAKVASQTPPAEVSTQEAPAQTKSYAGLWYDHSGRSAIRIENCGKGLCGKIAWLKNSDHKSVCGTDIIGGVQKVGNVYDNGWIYDIERGRKFDVELKLLSESKLRVKGYAGTKFLSKTMIWNRAPSDLQLCS